MPKKKKSSSSECDEEQVHKEKPKRQEDPKLRAQSKDWCFTWNNPSDDEILSINDWDYKYLIFQKEVGQNGTPHLQGFIQFEKQTRLSALKKLSKRIHWEKRRGSPYEASHYCEKPVKDCECKHCVEARLQPAPTHQYKDGCMSVSGSVRVDEIARSIKESSLSKTIERFPTAALMMSRGMEYLDNHYVTERHHKTKCTVIYGHPGKQETQIDSQLI